MPSDESLKIWPLPPGDGYQAQKGDLTQSPRPGAFAFPVPVGNLPSKLSTRFIPFAGSRLAELASAFGMGYRGSGNRCRCLFSDMLHSIIYGKEADEALDVRFGLALAVLCGAAGGFICGVGCWLISRMITGWRGDRGSKQDLESLP